MDKGLDDPKQNEYEKLLSKKLCVKIYCNTCGNMEFRKECKLLGGQLFDLMMELPESELLKHENYLESVNITIRCIPNIEMRYGLSQHCPNVFNKLLENSSLDYNGYLMTGHF